MITALNALFITEIAYSEQKRLEVNFYANDIGRVTSDPPGIDCTRGYCAAQYDAKASVTLTATPLTGTETGNHFVGWEIFTGDWVSNPYGGGSYNWIEEKRTTLDVLSLNLADYKDKDFYVNAVFKIERCLGGVGNGCGFLWDDSFNSFSKTYGEYGPDTDTDIVVGSILHDRCCYNNPNEIKRTNLETGKAFWSLSC